MKQRFSILDTRAIANELNIKLHRKYIQNFYSTQQRFMYIKFSSKDILLIEPGVRIHLTNQHGTEISHFCKKLREKCRHARVKEIYQHTFDRIVVIDIIRHKIVIEFFSGGNIIILGENDNIVDLLRPVPELGIVKNSKYIWNAVPLELNYSRFSTVPLNDMLPFEPEFIEIVIREMESRFNMKISELKQSKLIEEIDSYFKDLLNRIENIGKFGELVIKNGKFEQFLPFPSQESFYKMEKDTEDLSKNLSNLKVESNTNNFIIEKEDIVEKTEENKKENINESDEEENEINALAVNFWNKADAIKILKEKKNIRALHFRNYNETIDLAYSDRKKAEKVVENKADRIKKAQNQYVLQLEIQVDSLYEIAEILERNRKFVSEILNIFKKVYENRMEWKLFEHFWEDEKRKGNPHSLSIISYNLKDKTCIISLEDRHIELKLDCNVSKNIAEYYNKKKKLQEKSDKTKFAMENVIQKLAPKKEQIKPQIRVKYWFEKFHFFFSTSNVLVIGGKNAQENEIVVKNYLEKDDLYFHCSAHGASSVVSKGRDEVTINQAAIMAMCLSKCWEEGVVREIFYVEPDQVSKSAPSGEFISKGAFMIRGKKNILHPYRLEYGLGLLFKTENSESLVFESTPSGKKILHAMPTCAPWSVIKDYKYQIRLTPGNEKKSQIANNAISKFIAQSKDNFEENFVKSVSIDEYISVLISKSKTAKISK